MKAFYDGDMNRREILLNILASPLLKSDTRATEANARILEAVWQSTRDQFYDPQMHGVDWDAVKREFLPKTRGPLSEDQLISLLREMLSRLHNSHIFLYSREEWEWRRNILPFCLDRLGKRAFVRYILRGRDSTALASLQFGDEIIAVDGVPVDRLRPLTLARLDPIRDNPNFGPSGSIAEVEIRRDARLSVLKAARVVRPAGFETAIVEHPRSNIVHLRLFTLGSAELPATRLQRLWNEVTTAKGLILDLRDCVGGSPRISNFISGSLLGPAKPLFRSIPRQGSSEREVLNQSDPEAPRFVGRVAVITNSSTESQPELLAATCKEYGCAHIVGERTAGAFNGFTIAVDLPDNFASFALPYTRSVSAKGLEYEGRGVEPDEFVRNTESDFAAKRDSPLEAALRWVEL
jgi:C-terminal processing protease CtpA/Prc